MAEQQILGTKKPKYQKPRKISFTALKPPRLLKGKIDPKELKATVIKKVEYITTPTIKGKADIKKGSGRIPGPVTGTKKTDFVKVIPGFRLDSHGSKKQGPLTEPTDDKPLYVPLKDFQDQLMQTPIASFQVPAFLVEC